MSRCAPPQPGEDRKPWRGAFCLTEPIPYVGVETGMLGGKVRIAEWKEGEEPMLQVEKRGRFITNMGFANFVTAAVESDDPRIKGTCMVILEEDDPGTFDRGTPTRKLVHQLSSTRDPIFNLKVPASRIIGGYTVKDGVIVPRYSHGEIIEAVFRRTRVTVAIMTSAKLLSAVEPVIRYQRNRFRGGSIANPGSPRYELGLQLKQDVVHRLVDVWATGEASASLGFEAARVFDQLDPLEKEKDALLAEAGVKPGSATLKVMRSCAEERHRVPPRPASRYGLRPPGAIRHPRFRGQCPLPRLQALEHRPRRAHDARSRQPDGRLRHHRRLPRLPGPQVDGCPARGHLRRSRGRAAPPAQRHHDRRAVPGPVPRVDPRDAHHRQRPPRDRRLRAGHRHADVALDSLQHLQNSADADGAKLYQSARQGVTFPLADALCWLLASRSQILDLLELEKNGAENPALAEGLPGLLAFLTDLCHVQSARAAGEVGRICAELVFGYNRHPAWDTEGCATCYQADDLDAMEALIPGIASLARGYTDVIESDGSHPPKAGPCARFDGLDQFTRLRVRMDGCLTGSQLAKDRAADALTKVMIPEALDYPA